MSDIVFEKNSNQPLIDLSDVYMEFIKGGKRRRNKKIKLYSRARLVFEINKDIKLALIGKKTCIFVGDKKISHCKFLLISKPLSDVKECTSMDQVINNLDGKMERRKYRRIVPSDEVFWGHCSNIQAWVENDYDSHLIHSDLGFPILKALKNVGDQKASSILKENILTKFKEHDIYGICFLLENKYLKNIFPDISKEELFEFIGIHEIESKYPIRSLFILRACCKNLPYGISLKLRWGIRMKLRQLKKRKCIKWGTKIDIKCELKQTQKPLSRLMVKYEALEEKMLFLINKGL